MQNVFSAKNQIKFAEQSLKDYIYLKNLCEKKHINNTTNKFSEFDFQDLVIDNLIIGYGKLKFQNFKLKEVIVLLYMEKVDRENLLY